MKNIMCYLLIIISLVFIIVPPVLRKFNPKPEEEKKEVITALTCTRDTEKIVYSFKSKIPYSFKYSFTADSEEAVPYKDLFNSCKMASDYDGDSLYIINDENSYCLLNINSATSYMLDPIFKKDDESMKKYFQNEGFTCFVQEY